MADQRSLRPPAVIVSKVIPPRTRYAKSGDASIVCQVVGDAPIDLVLVLGFATHLELQWEAPPFAHFFERISSFSRLIIFDKRGTGLSDPVSEAPTLEVSWAPLATTSALVEQPAHVCAGLLSNL